MAARARDAVHLTDLPNVGPSIAGDLRRLGICAPADLEGRDPAALFDALCASTGVRQDPCVLDTFTAAVAFVNGGPARPWWEFSALRKRAARSVRSFARRRLRSSR